MAPHPIHRDDGASSSAGRFHCKHCQLSFHSFDRFFKHLNESPIHFPCLDCHTDYHSPEALDRHKKQNHAHEQHVTCWGCKKTFKRAGALMSHIEHEQCPYVKSGYIEELRASNPNNSGRLQKFKAASEAIWASDQDAPTWEATKDANAEIPSGSFGKGNAAHGQAWGAQATFNKADDLIDLDPKEAPSRVLNADWGEFPSLPAPSATFVKNFGVNVQNKVKYSSVSISEPGHGANGQGQVGKIQEVSKPTSEHGVNVAKPSCMSDSTGHQVNAAKAPVTMRNSAVNRPANPSTSAASTPAVSAWSQSNTSTVAILFPNAPPAVASTAELLESLTLSSAERKPVYGEHDPYNPDFDASRYYCKFAQGYRCPNKKNGTKCKKVQPSVSSFIAHLKSAVHMDLQEIACPNCLRIFMSSTAVTQHFESQAIRCNARKLGHADVLVEDITQVITKEGEFEDDTNRYVNKPSSGGQMSPGQGGAAVGQHAADWGRRTLEDTVNATKKMAEENYKNAKW